MGGGSGGGPCTPDDTNYNELSLRPEENGVWEDWIKLPLPANLKKDGKFFLFCELSLI